MAMLEEFAPRVEQYSIDEAFLDLTGVCQDDPVAYGLKIKKAVFQPIFRTPLFEICI